MDARTLVGSAAYKRLVAHFQKYQEAIGHACGPKRCFLPGRKMDPCHSGPLVLRRDEHKQSAFESCLVELIDEPHS
ncbi:hypothetical protein EB796_006100 [Bugula neritina]|uniref:Uncharacterized protein n=1 Tax=Bugula neritina TaxID=10212 RepID=A0A7J7KCK9_BUGNE|nr:hypothetical protein EB796_006100 [Bugula neritina]